MDSASATADEVGGFLEERGCATAQGGKGGLRLLVTDVPKSFAEVAARFLGEAVEDVEQIDL